jgi:hypothetical protein
MSGDQLHSRSPVVEDDLAKHAADNELFRRTEHRRKVAVQTLSNETCLQFVKSPGVAFAVTQHIILSAMPMKQNCTSFRSLTAAPSPASFGFRSISSKKISRGSGRDLAVPMVRRLAAGGGSLERTRL